MNDDRTRTYEFRVSRIEYIYIYIYTEIMMF